MFISVKNVIILGYYFIHIILVHVESPLFKTVWKYELSLTQIFLFFLFYGLFVDMRR